MLITPTPENVAFFGALASEVRLRIIQLLLVEELNIKELAERTGVSSPIMLKHIKTLESVGIVSSRLVNRDGSTSRVCTLVFAEHRFLLGPHRRGLPAVYQVSVPVGHYFDIRAEPTCGLATETQRIGFVDDPKYFWDPERVNAQLLWLNKGYVEYRVPDYLSDERRLLEIELSFEIASEAPDFVDDWPSDISFYMNGVKLFTWTSPGDFGERRGVLTPEWWPSNQYGLLKVVHIRPVGVILDETKVSDVTLEQVLSAKNTDGGMGYWSMRFEAPPDAKHAGGLTLFGKKFGNHAQDIVLRVFYERNKYETAPEAERAVGSAGMAAETAASAATANA